MELIAPNSFAKAPMAIRERVCNGMGPEGLERIVPDTIWLLNANGPANIHDWMYQDIAMGKGFWAIRHPYFGEQEIFIPVNKGVADTFFLINLLLLIDNSKSFRIVKWLRRYRAMTYFNFVHDGGNYAILRAREKGKGNTMRKFSKLAIFFLIVLFVGLLITGCNGKRPQQVSAAVIERDKAIRTYVANDNAADAFLIEKYMEAERKQVDLLFELKVNEINEAIRGDLEALAKKSPNGKLELTPGQAMNVSAQLDAKKLAALKSRDEKYQEISKVGKLLMAAREKNKINLAIREKLNAAIAEYENAGIDMSAAEKSVAEILQLLKQYELLGNSSP